MSHASIAIDLPRHTHHPPVQGLLKVAAADEAVLANVQKLRHAWGEKDRVVLDVGHGSVRPVRRDTDLYSDHAHAQEGFGYPLVEPDDSAFLSTNLAYVLRRFKGFSNRLVVAGLGAEGIVESTVRDGADKGWVGGWVGGWVDGCLGGGVRGERECGGNSGGVGIFFEKGWEI
jgi:nicotinamidase-related amidase